MFPSMYKMLEPFAGQPGIFIQFLRESLVISFVSLLIALLAAQLLLPAYNILVQKNLTLDYADSKLWIFAIAIVIIVGLVSGLYPGLYRASFRPVDVLKGKVTSGAGGSIVKKIWAFPLAGLLCGVFALLIVGIKVYRASYFNSISALRSA